MRRIACTLLPLALTGCAMAPTAAPSAKPGVAIQGVIHGGQQPIVGAEIFLFAVNTTGYGGNGIAADSGNASISLLNNGSGNASLDATSGNYYVTTDQSGNFSISGDYNCTTGQQLYLYGVGGDAGGGPNSDIGLLAALGPCGSLSPSTYVMVNEVSTIATAYALAGFASDATHISSSGTALAQTGIANAFANVNSLEDLATGTARSVTPNGTATSYGTVPQLTINALANILAACVNSSDTGFSNCSTLFCNATTDGTTTGTQPTDTATAAINIAHNPGTNVVTLFNLIPSAPPYVTNNSSAPPFSALTSAPNDFTLSISYSGSGMYYPDSIAIDASGNAWIANLFGPLSKISSTSLTSSGDTGYSGGGLTGASSVAIDLSGNVWALNSQDGGVIEFSSQGAASSSSPYFDSNVGVPFSIAFDASGDFWVGGSTNDLVKFTVSGPSVTSMAFSNSSFVNSVNLAIDQSGYVWAAGQDPNKVPEVSSSGSLVSPDYSNAGPSYSGTVESVALDHAGNLWVADLSSSIYKLPINLPISAPINGGGPTSTNAIAIDGSGNVWVGDTSGVIGEYSNSGSPITSTNGYGYGSGNLSQVASVAIDGSGDVWAANRDFNTVVEFIGAATPVVTPLVANLIAPYFAPASKP